MTSERHARVKELFHRALDRPRGEREAFLRGACGDDGELLGEVREMLAFEESSPDFLEPSTVPEGLLAGAVRAAAPPEQLGPFRILRLLGEGGMGAVYEAEQERPRRRVALKVLQPGLGTPAMLRRFELEGEVLARLEHPGIARLYEAGSSDTGRGLQPWFAMELVEGRPLTEHCLQGALPLEERLELVAKVCDAVQHAHLRGIVHRDLKPANVLVDGAGQPKVLDFGIARATDADLQSTLRTDPGMIVGTLQYMSPEQAAADPDAVDVRSDVYSLGVMLYELVAGRPPLELARTPMHEAVRRVIEVEPTSLRTVSGRVPGDVAVIAHKALEKDKERRYASAAELAADLRRYLRREPITAQAPSGWYRLRRFAARNKALVGGVAATFLALAAGLALALWQRDEARQALARAEGVNRFLLDDLLASPTPERLGHEVRVADILGPAARSAERTFADQPRVAAEVLDAVGASYSALGLYPEAEEVLRRALTLLEDGPRDRLALRVRGHLVGAIDSLGRTTEAVALGAEVVQESVRTLGPRDPDTLEHRARLAVARYAAGEREQALGELRAIQAERAASAGAQDPDTLEAASQLAVFLAASDEVTEARDLLGDALARQERVLGADHPATLASRTRLAWILLREGAWEELAALDAETVPALERAYGPEHPFAAHARLMSTEALLRLGRLDQAEEAVRVAGGLLEERLGPDHRWTLEALEYAIKVHYRREEFPEAIARAEALVERHRAAGRAEELASSLMTLGRSHQEAGQLARAGEVFAQALESYRALDLQGYVSDALYNLAVVRRDGGDPAAAVEPMREALAIDREVFGAETLRVQADRYVLAEVLIEVGQAAEAAQLMRAVLEACATLEVEHERVLGYTLLLGRALLAQGEAAEAERHLLAVHDGFGELGRPDDRRARRAREALVRLYEDQGRAAEAALLRDGDR